MSKPKVLHLTVSRETFAAVMRGDSTAEYRDRNAYWKSRLVGRSYDSVRLRTGTGSSGPEVEIGFLRVQKVLRDGKGQYAILLCR